MSVGAAQAASSNVATQRCCVAYAATETRRIDGTEQIGVTLFNNQATVRFP